ncbi:MAG: hypothetical protein KDK70_33540, partial [Myxococcales bacterium]|nr:hypothetical protein [Myxococcales bacterium]
ELARMPAEAEAPAEAAPAPEAESAAPPPTEAPPPAVPESTGLGLMITAGALGAVGWGVMGWRMSIVKNGCQNDTDLETLEVSDAEELVGSGVGCINARVKSTAAWLLQAGPNSANWVIAPLAGSFRGKYDAARFALEGGRDRKPNVFIGVGAGLLAAGAIGRFAVLYIRARSIFSLADSYVASCIADDMSTTPEQFFDCYARKNMLHFFGQQITSAGIGAGAGLLAYGVAYKKNRDKYLEGKGGEQARLEFSVAPSLSLHHTGVTASLRF